MQHRDAGRPGIHRHSPAVYRRRRLLFLLATACLILVPVLLFDKGGSTLVSPVPIAAPGGWAPGPARLPVASGRPEAAVASTTTTTATTTTGAGALPQTGAFPRASSAAFSARMSAFWDAVTSGDAQQGMAAFFPLGAYVQVKATSDPGADWAGRLVDSYDRDIAAAHQLLGPAAGSAELLGVRVYLGAAHWVAPGNCYNNVGYFEVPNSRVVYQVNGQVRSFGIASMISWRGEWYVVHLGGVDETPGMPTVDAPAAGPGHPRPLYTC